MHALIVLFKVVMIGAGAIVALGAAVAGMFAWSSSRAVEAHSRCEMRIMEHKIEQDHAREYRRICMKSEGYLIDSYCFAQGYSIASCFVPRWVWWIDKVDF
ncbi:hypothetical protein N7E70_018150 [Aminobacter sp. NyZ550]|uniref:hypothetical protein n=1 Tax=Aminobacter sp. NyZ550 TaxID=2979870 RepID=UPI0021D57E26|nr:hypothetical protein [Aminobacter sp. NyZ550]WAX93599.1 hypothetical protein N7E70_018150 [Aminobacter sp. NyZ550]